MPLRRRRRQQRHRRQRRQQCLCRGRKAGRACCQIRGVDCSISRTASCGIGQAGKTRTILSEIARGLGRRGLSWGELGSRSRCRAKALRSAGAVLTGPGGSSPPCRLIRMVWSINESPHGLFPCPRSLRPDSEELSGACAPPPRSGDTVACVSENTNPAQTLTPRKPISPPSQTSPVHHQVLEFICHLR